MKRLLLLFAFAVSFVAAQPYTTTITTQIITETNCVGVRFCTPGIQVTVQPTDQQAIAVLVQFSYAEPSGPAAGRPMLQSQIVPINPGGAVTVFPFLVPESIHVRSIVAWPLIPPPQDPPAIVIY